MTAQSAGTSVPALFFAGKGLRGGGDDETLAPNMSEASKNRPDGVRDFTFEAKILYNIKKYRKNDSSAPEALQRVPRRSCGTGRKGGSAHVDL